jgi:hypothetical protein
MWRGSIDIMQILGHKNVAFINNYSTLSEERHKKISNILSNTESETNRNSYLLDGIRYFLALID